MAEGSTILDLTGLQALVDALWERGYTVLGPTIRDGAIVNGEIRTLEDLPRGWGDDQEAAHYRLRRRDDDALFAFAAGAQSAKSVFFPASELMWRGRREGTGFAIESVEPARAPEPERPYALLGTRSCDLQAVAIQDRVLLDRPMADPRYAARRAGTFVVAVTCTDPGGTCFCVSMGSGPSPQTGFDIALTELLHDGPHRFVAVAGSDRGRELLAALPGSEPAAGDLAAADRVVASSTRRMGRVMQADGLRDLLYANAESPRWDDVASRCLSCTNCTLVCPTCFCTAVQDVTDLTGTSVQRHRVWDSCFSAEYSYLHGGSVRKSTRSRYRQWMTHKLASWVDQFGTSGCVGCGRCVTWCPAAIDITVEAAAIRAGWPADSSAPPAAGPEGV